MTKRALADQLEHHVANLNWMLGKIPTAPDQNPPLPIGEDGESEYVDRPMTFGEIKETMAGHAKSILQLLEKEIGWL